MLKKPLPEVDAAVKGSFIVAEDIPRAAMCFLEAAFLKFAFLRCESKKQAFFFGKKQHCKIEELADNLSLQLAKEMQLPGFCISY